MAVDVTNNRQSSQPVGIVFSIYFIIFIIIYFPLLTDLNITIDDETALQRSSAAIWAEQGRWAAYLFEEFVFPNPVVPYMPLVIFGASLIIGYMLILKTFRSPPTGYLQFLLFSVLLLFPTWIFILEFESNSAFTGVGFALVCFSAYCYALIMRREGVYDRQRIALVFLVFSSSTLATGLYQSFIIAFIVLASSIIFNEYAIQHYRYRNLIKYAAALGIFCASSIASHLLLNKVILRALSVPSQGYVESFFRPQEFVNNPSGVIDSVISEYQKIFWGIDNFYGLPLFGFGVFIVSATIILLFISIKKGALCIGLSLGFIVLMHILVMALNFVAGGFLPYRVLVAAPLLLVALSMLVLPHLERAGRIALTLPAALAVFQGMSFISIVAGNQQLTARHDEFLAGEIFTRVAEVGVRHPQTGRYSIDTFGMIDHSPAYPIPLSMHSGLSWFVFEGGRAIRIAGYMRMHGYPVELAPNQERIDINWNWSEMPRFPREGSVRQVGDVTLVKLGDEPGPAHLSLARDLFDERDDTRAVQFSAGLRGGSIRLINISENADGSLRMDEDPQIILDAANFPGMESADRITVQVTFRTGDFLPPTQLFVQTAEMGYTEETSLRTIPYAIEEDLFVATFLVPNASQIVGFRLDPVAGAGSLTVTDLQYALD